MIIKRDLLAQIEPYLSTKQAIVITGMRRVGKTTLLRNIFDTISSNNKLFLDLENILNQKIFEETDYEAIKSTWESQGIDFKQRVFLFLDEIQFIKNVPSIVKYFIDHYQVKFFLTGSASFYLKNVFSESLSGRKFIFELYPFSFDEFLTLKNESMGVPRAASGVSQAIYLKLDRLYTEYMEFGGFPDVILAAAKEEKKRILEDIISSYIHLEVMRLSDFRKIHVIRDLILLLAERVGQKLEIQKLGVVLGISRETVMNYLAFLEGTYAISLVKPFSRSLDVEIRKTPKIYFCDSGLANHLGRITQGSLFEQNIFQNIRHQGEINYYQKKTGSEIDFILSKKTAYECAKTSWRRRAGKSSLTKG